MVHASSESDFERILISANNLLDAQTSKNNQDKEDLQNFQSICHSYAEYKLNEIPGNRGLHESAPSEQNHLRCSKETKFAISSLAIQTEKLLLHKTGNQLPMEFLSQSSINEDYNQREVEKYLQNIKSTSAIDYNDIIKPPSNAFRSEPKLCLKQAREVHQRKKFKSILQNAGVAQTVYNGRHAIMANGKTGHKMTCASVPTTILTQVAQNEMNTS